ncbi:lysyl-tRNA synthetase class II [Propionicimonas paludicola]|uniref:Lysyl-tRNA synthetase class II n=1 Tax=Propionicimonas paludicola TaxID=185243 RepID=A0A2A9CQ46_9ACTN|nr:phosphatidylglycerol lysyltransferase domain-containing protein [Propionicimonas paludicola]PFG15732.1 lysyl-tRNA synthetase class II [Propionicimonas paludicola]
MSAPTTSGSFADRGARILTAVYALSTAVALVTWLLGHWGSPQPNWPELVVTLFNIPLSRSIASVALLALISRALLGRKRVGLIAVAVCQVLGMYLGLAVLVSWPVDPVLHAWRQEHLLVAWLDVASLPLGAIILVLLWKIRPAFVGRVRPGSWWRAITAAVVGLGITLGATAAMISAVVPAREAESPRLFFLVLSRALGERGRPTHGVLALVPSWVPTVTSALLTITLLVTVTAFLRYARDVTRWSAQREIDIRRLIRDFGAGDSLAYFATRRDKSSVFSPDGRAVVAYGVYSGVSIASGDPIGRPESWPAAIRAWKDDAVHYGWIPAVLAASTEGARSYAQQGLRVLALGDEAVLDAQSFTTEGKAMAAVRSAAQHARRAGLEVRYAYQADLSQEELARLQEVGEKWRHGDTERGFSMALNRFADPADTRILFVQAYDADGNLQGLLSFVPWGPNGLSLDMMRRSPSAPHGVTELMISELMAAAPALGVRWVSLNFCMFRRVYSDADEFGANAFVRLNSSFLGVLDRFWQLGRLYRSNRQYNPRWQPRFLCYDDRVGLPQILIALGSAEGFLPRLRITRPTVERELSADELAAVRELAAEPPQVVEAGLDRQSEQVRARQAHLDELARRAVPPYRPEARPGTISIARLPEASVGSSVEVAGRVRAIRNHGQLVFADLAGDGAEIQLLLEPSSLAVDEIADFRRLVDEGDVVSVRAEIGFSRTGTPSLIVGEWAVLAKALYPLAGEGSVEQVAEGPSGALELIEHPEQLALLRHRGRVLQALRSAMDEAGYAEVATPSGELASRYLTRLVIAGAGPVYEVVADESAAAGEPVDLEAPVRLHALAPGGDYLTMRQLTEELIAAADAGLPGSVGAGALALVFSTEPDLELAPDAAPHRNRPGHAEHWELAIGGITVAAASSVLTDPIELRRRLSAEAFRASGELRGIDESYLRDLELGMPPTGRLEVDLDQLTRALTERAAAASH